MSGLRSASSPVGAFSFFLFVGGIGLAIGKASAFLPPQVVLMLSGSLAILVLSFFSANFTASLIVLAMLLSPEIAVGNVPGRDITIRVEDLLLIVLGGIGMLRLAASRQARLHVSTPLNPPIILYSLSFILSTALAMMLMGLSPLRGTFFALKYIEYFVIYYLTLGVVQTRKEYKLFLTLFLITFAIVNIFAWTQAATVNRVAAPFEGDQPEPNTLGGYQVLIFAVIMGLFLYTRSVFLKVIYIGMILMMIFPFLRTLSRASFTAIVPTYLSFLWFTGRKRTLLVSVFFLAVILAVLFLPEQVRTRIKDTFTAHEQKDIAPVTVAGITFGPSASARLRSYIRACEEWQKRPVLGWGITGAGFIDGQYFRNLVELGAIGVLAFVFLLGSIYKSVYRIYRQTNDPLYKGLALGVLAGHVGMIFHATTANTFILIRIMEPYWFLMAMVMMIPKVEEVERQKAREAPLPEPVLKVPEKKPAGYSPRNIDYVLN